MLILSETPSETPPNSRVAPRTATYEQFKVKQQNPPRHNFFETSTLRHANRHSLVPVASQLSDQVLVDAD